MTTQNTSTIHYQKDLNGHFKTSKWETIFGWCALALGLIYIIRSIIIEGQFTRDWFFSFLLILNGVMAIYRSKGIIPFRKAFVQIDDEAIEIKILEGKKIIFWNDVKTFDLRDKKIKVIPENHKFAYIPLHLLSDEARKEILDNIIKIAKQKKIEVLLDQETTS